MQKNTIKYSMRDKIFEEFAAEKARCGKLCFRINKTEPYTPELKALIDELFDGKLDNSVHITPPIQIDLVRKLKIGKNVIIENGFDCLAMGEIEIEDNVMIAASVSIITVNHDLQDRYMLLCNPVHIKKNAWIGTRAIILSGVTIGENSVVAAGAVVTKDVPDNTIVGGNPARVLKEI